MTTKPEWRRFTGHLIKGGLPNTFIQCFVSALEHRNGDVTYTKISITGEWTDLRDGNYELSFAGKTVQKVERLNGAFKNNGNLSLN
jgi:hypothetical protein